MGSLTLTISYTKNTGLVLNASELKQLYFTGIKLEDQYGNPIPDETIEFYIDAAQEEMTTYLCVKLSKHAVSEQRDFVYDDWIKWGAVTTFYPVVTPISLQGFLNTTLQIDYPANWLSAKKQSPIGEEDMYHRNVSIVPVQGTAAFASGSSIYVGIVPLSNRWGAKSVPNYWTITYITGFSTVPADILNFIGRMAASNLLLLLGDIISGQPGISNKSIGIDGLSQSVSTTNSSGNTTFGGRIKAWQTEMARQLPILKMKYVGFTFGVLG